MSSDSDPAASRPTNLNNSVNDSNPGISPYENERDIPTVESRVSEFYQEFPQRAQLPLSDRDGQTLRRAYVRGRWNSWTSDPDKAPEVPHEKSVSGSREIAVDPLKWGEAVEKMLEKYEDTRRTTINLERGRPDSPGYETFSVEATTRWMASYQKTYYAQLEAWMRELTGGERPSGGESDPHFRDPHIVLITRSGSSVPRGDRLPPVDHWTEINDAWNGTSEMNGSVYDTLRNTLRSLGFSSDQWQYERRLEPHTGKRGGGLNRAYGHEHIVLVIDGHVTESDFRPVLDKHVELCDCATSDAHRVGDAVEVFEPNDLDHSVAKYVASYANIEPTGLLERSIDYIAWAAAMDASNTRTKSRSDAANWASTADSCKQRFESDKSDQSVNHGEKIIPSNRRGIDLECAKCGSPHGIDQEQTLSTARIDSAGPVAADGGRLDLEEKAKNLWQDAESYVAIGETLTDRNRIELIKQYFEENPDASIPELLGSLNLPPSATDLVHRVIDGESRRVSFTRPPQWQVKSVEIGEEVYPASAGNGIEMVELDMSENGTVESDVWSGRKLPTGEEIEYIYRRSSPGETVECAVTGEALEIGYRVVVTDGNTYNVLDVKSLSEWVIDL